MNYSGHDGVVRVGANVVAEMNDWSVDETAETIEDSEASDTDKTYKAGQRSWSGSINAHYDDTDTLAQGAMVPGSTVAVEFLPGGVGSGLPTLSGSALITGQSVGGGKGNIVSGSYSLQGTGGLVRGVQG
ncbi:MAG: hypothetical protein OEW37_08780 [Rhodospirillaceae bacterium]|nr:hypothetical protein [Rhodospirillaceae bacterium]